MVLKRSLNDGEENDAEKRAKVEESVYATNEEVLDKLNKALEGKTHPEDWNECSFYVTIVDGCGSEEVNSEVTELKKVLKGSDLTELDFKMIAAILFRIDHVVDDAGRTIYPIDALRNWLQDPNDYIEDDESFECNKKTFGHLHAVHKPSTDVFERCIVVRGGL